MIFTRWPEWDSKLTEWITHGLAAHEETIRADGGAIFTFTASKAFNRMVSWSWESRKHYFAKTKTEWCRYTPTIPLTPEQTKKLEYYFEEAKNTFKYSRGELVLQALDSLHNWLFNVPYDSAKAVRFRKLGDIRKQAVVCSKIVNIGLARLGFLPAWSEYWSPADTLTKLRSSTTWTLAEATAGFFPATEAK